MLVAILVYLFKFYHIPPSVYQSLSSRLFLLFGVFILVPHDHAYFLSFVTTNYLLQSIAEKQRWDPLKLLSNWIPVSFILGFIRTRNKPGKRVAE
jgi:ribosomal protein S18 acetylase RimI-like enzyme